MIIFKLLKMITARQESIDDYSNSATKDNIDDIVADITEADEVSEAETEDVSNTLNYTRYNLIPYMSLGEDFILSNTYCYIDIYDDAEETTINDTSCINATMKLSYDATFKGDGTGEGNLSVDFFNTTGVLINNTGSEFNIKNWDNSNAKCIYINTSSNTMIYVPNGYTYNKGDEFYFTAIIKKNSGVYFNPNASEDITSDITTGYDLTYDYLKPAWASTAGLYINWSKFNIYTKTYDSSYIKLEWEGTTYDYIPKNTFYIAVFNDFITTSLPISESSSTKEYTNANLVWSLYPNKGLVFSSDSNIESGTSFSGSVELYAGGGCEWSLLYSNSDSSNSIKTSLNQINQTYWKTFTSPTTEAHGKITLINHNQGVEVILELAPAPLEEWETYIDSVNIPITNIINGLNTEITITLLLIGSVFTMDSESISSELQMIYNYETKHITLNAEDNSITPAAGILLRGFIPNTFLNKNIKGQDYEPVP